MPEFARLLDPDYYLRGGEVSIAIVEACLLAFSIAAILSLACFRSSLQKKSPALFWLGAFSSAYALWNLFYLSSYTQRDIPFPRASLSVEFAHRAHIVLALFLPYLAYRFLSAFFNQRRRLSRLSFLGFIAAVAILWLPEGRYYVLALLGAGLVIFISFLALAIKLYNFYRESEDLKLKTRSYFILVGMVVCTVFSFIGQIRSEGLFELFPLPFVGNIATAVFLSFVYQMVMNPRLREIRELMLRGIRVILLTFILSIFSLSLLAWVGQNDPELFIFNTFIASFIILIIMEPLRKRLDAFFVKQFIVDRYEFEELLKKLPKKLRSAKSLEELASLLLNGIRESGRIYQTALYLWDPVSKDYRLVPPSNLPFKATLEIDHPFIRFFKNSKSTLVMEQDQEVDVSVRDALRDLHTHIAIPLFRQDELLGVWSLRSSLRSTNPYTSFSNEEILLLEQVSQDLVAILEQLQHFEAQERQERLAALGEMSAALAHEIRNPLGAIQGATQLLVTSPSLENGEDRECVGILVKEIDRMHRTVEQYLNFARVSEEPLLVPVKPLIEGVIQDVRPKAEKTRTLIHLETATEDLALKTDPLKLEQVLFNLIQNACEAFSKNIWVKLETKEIGGRVGLSMSVRDDGPGIPAQHLTNIFTPLFTTKKAGSGLGLPICKKIIDSLGGDLSVESQMGVGTIFMIWLPLEIARLSAPAHLQPSPSPAASN